MSVSDGARAANLAQQRAKRDEPGFYVVNAMTGIVVRGPFDSFDAADKQRWLMCPTRMSVAELPVRVSKEQANA